MLYNAAAAALLSLVAASQAHVTGLDPNNLPYKAGGSDQYGYNNCSTIDSPTSNCQTLVMNSLSDFCLFAGPYRAPVGSIERKAVAFCLKAGRGARLMPPGTITGAHFVRTPDYFQITGTGDFTKINVPKGDQGGELDPWGYDVKGNPIGGVVIGKKGSKLLQFPNWTQFLSEKEFCIRVCYGNSAKAKQLCNHVYDELGCQWNIPGDYSGKTFDQCLGDDTEPMGVYTLKNGKVSTWSRNAKPTPPPHPAAKTSSCASVSTLAYGTYPPAAPSSATKKSSSVPKSSTKKTAAAKAKATGHHKRIQYSF